MKGITDPNDVAASLYGEGLLTANERDQVMQATQTIDQKNQHLLRFLEARIASDNDAFDKLVEIFENEDAYASLAKKLKDKRGASSKPAATTESHTAAVPSKPDKDKVLNDEHTDDILRIIRKCAAKWKEIGRGLGFKKSELDDISTETGRNTTVDYLEALISRWLNWAPPSHPFPNQKDLAGVLRSSEVKEEALAYTLGQANFN
eukprot:Em0007g592a